MRTLEATVLKMKGAPSARIITPAKPGLDFAAIRVGGGHLIVSADPITGVSSEIGYYAIKVGANDVATSGNRPQFAETVVLLPERSTAANVFRLAKQLDRAAREIGIAIVGGHTEVTPGLDRPVVVVTVFSFVKRFVTSRDAEAGDTIMMSKTAGLEGTAALASEWRNRTSLPKGLLEVARGFVRQLSVIDEAVAAFQTDEVHAMHDCTEGGVLGAAYEMSSASGLGFEIAQASIPVAPETTRLCRDLHLDPLRLIGSGSLLLSVRNGGEERVKHALRRICQVTTIGKFTGDGRILVRSGGVRSRISTAPKDELWRVLGRRL